MLLLPASDATMPYASRYAFLRRGKGVVDVLGLSYFFHCIRFSSLRSNFELAVQFHGHGYTALFSFGFEKGAT
jgi:hypothetical protein